jgi:hypothetical protein
LGTPTYRKPEKFIMQRREFMELLAAAGTGALFSGGLAAAESAGSADKKLIGMYVHQGWVYNRPYAARAWTDEDWHGYLDGLHRLGFNLVSIWPQLETMPHPLTPSDQAKLEQHRRVIDVAHREFGMKVWIILCPNIVPIDDYARRVTFEQRAYYGADFHINPADPQAVDAMMVRREQLLKPLAAMDGLVVIDSDPGGYPNSTNKEFVSLLMRHRRLLDQLRPEAIELVYWCWAGWAAYCRYYATGKFSEGNEKEFLETLTMLKDQNPEPWGLARGLEYAQKLGLQSKVINFAYGAIEGEPVFPITNFGPHAIGDPYKAGQEMSPRGTQANAQTHCVQLPGTFAFSRGARGLQLVDKDYVQFADELVRGQGEQVVAAWRALSGLESEPMKKQAAELATVLKAKLEPGPLRGLLFGDGRRFVKDLYLMLRLKSAAMDCITATNQNRPLRQPLAEFISWLDRWHVVTGYEGWWGWAAGGDINGCLMRLNSPVLADFFRNLGLQFMKTGVGTPAERIAAGNYRNETETLRLVHALKQSLWDMEGP